MIVRSIFDRTRFVLGRAIAVAAPAGFVIWLFANINIGDLSILTHVANFFDPFAKLMGLDGYILTAFILGIQQMNSITNYFNVLYGKRNISGFRKYNDNRADIG